MGIGHLIDQVDGYVKTLFGAVPPQASAILGMAKLDVAINIILAAVIARLLLAGIDKVTGTITGLALLNKVGG